MHTPYDDQGIPVSAGIPPIVRITGGILLVLIFALLTMVFLDASANHVWPSANSATLPLPKAK